MAIIKRRIKKKISILNCSGEGTFGGAITYVKYLKKGLEWAGFDVDFTSHTKIGNPDCIIMASLGLNGEKNPEVNKRRLDCIGDKLGKIPFVLIRHGVTELRTFKNSYDFFKDKVFNLIVSVEDTKDMTDHITKTMKFDKLVYVGHPFEFTDSLENKTKYKDWIASSARFAGCKNNDLVLQMSDSIFPEKKFNVWGEEKGIYWYHAIKNSPYREKSVFRGRYTDYKEIYKDSAFGIDLTYIHSGSFVDGNRTQYTVIEAVDCGAIPIGFDVWASVNGYEGIWLPSPTKKGNRMAFDEEKIFDIVKNSEYDWDMARNNFKKLSDICDYKKIGLKFKEELMKII